MIEPENSWTIEKQTAQARNLSRFEELTVTIPGKSDLPPSVSSQPIPRNEKARENMADPFFPFLQLISEIRSGKIALLKQKAQGSNLGFLETSHIARTMLCSHYMRCLLFAQCKKRSIVYV